MNRRRELARDAASCLLAVTVMMEAKEEGQGQIQDQGQVLALVAPDQGPGLALAHVQGLALAPEGQGLVPGQGHGPSLVLAPDRGQGPAQAHQQSPVLSRMEGRNLAMKDHLLGPPDQAVVHQGQVEGHQDQEGVHQGQVEGHQGQAENRQSRVEIRQSRVGAHQGQGLQDQVEDRPNLEEGQGRTVSEFEAPQMCWWKMLVKCLKGLII